MQVAMDTSVTWWDGLGIVRDVALALGIGFLRPRLLRNDQIRVWRKDGRRHDCVMGYETKTVMVAVRLKNWQEEDVYKTIIYELIISLCRNRNIDFYL